MGALIEALMGALAWAVLGALKGPFKPPSQIWREEKVLVGTEVRGRPMAWTVWTSEQLPVTDMGGGQLIRV